MCSSATLLGWPHDSRMALAPGTTTSCTSSDSIGWGCSAEDALRPRVMTFGSEGFLMSQGLGGDPPASTFGQLARVGR